MSDKTSDIGAIRLGVLAVGVMVFGLGLGAFVSYLNAEQSKQPVPSERSERQGSSDQSSGSKEGQSGKSGHSSSVEMTDRSYLNGVETSLAWVAKVASSWVEPARAAEGADPDSKTNEEASEEEGSAEFTAELVAKRIQTFYRETSDFKATFKQVYHGVAAGEKKVRWGRVYFKTPGNMRWDYYEQEALEDRTKTLVSDGNELWVYELEFQQVFKECLSEKQLPTSLKFLMGQGELLADFNVSFTEESTRESPELELVPKKPTPKYKKLHFKVDSDAEQVTKTTVFDPYGNTNTIHFREVAINSNLPDSGFEFEPPENARIIKKNVSCE